MGVVISFLVPVCFLLMLVIHDLSKKRSEGAKEVSEYLTRIHRLRVEKSVLIEEYNVLVKKSNALVREVDLLRQQKPQGASLDGISKKDLERMRNYLHPDKHNGKTSDLFIKVNDLLK